MNIVDVLDVVAKFSIVIGVLGYLHSRRSLRLQHERARREKATSAINELAKSMNARSAAARKLVRQLDKAQIDHIYDGTGFEIGREHIGLLTAAIPDHIDESKLPSTGNILLSQNQSYLLRWEIVHHLNCCEVLAQQWLKDVAHKETIEEECDILLNELEGSNIRTDCRRLAERKRLPALYHLVEKLESSRKPPLVDPVKLDEAG